MIDRLTIFLLLISAPVFAANMGQGLDIPASEPLEDEVIDAPQPIVKKPAKIKKQKTPPAPKIEEQAKESNLVVLQGLNKVIGRVYKLEIPLGTVTRFENLEIIARKCVKTIDPLENAALLEIREVKTGKEPNQIFLGWMFSSSPSISSIEHPVYDISVVSCEARNNPENLPAAKK